MKYTENIYKQLRTPFIPLCIKSYYRYYFNLLSIITLFCNFYFEHEIYAMSYKNKEGMRKWDDYITWDERLINMRYLLYIKL